MKDENIKRASLQEMRALKERGELAEPGPGFREELPLGFWNDAELVNHNRPEPRSVHLKLDPEVFDYFKSQGKGHITRMQNVLKAYVRAHTTGR